MKLKQIQIFSDILEPCSIAEWNNVTTSSIIFGDLHLKQLASTSKKVYCRYYDCNRQELNGTAWQTIMFPLSAAYCIRQAGAVYMLLTDSPDESPLFDPVPLTLRIDKNYKHEISVCVGPVYGEERRWLEIVETTEHHLLMGINHFYYTILNKMNEYTRKIVDEYERLGYFDVTVIQNEYDTMDWMSHLLQIYVSRPGCPIKG
uniref:Glycosyltransferase family 92 protein n=1 Tax=Caenorhabditis japonica TaxID=281687 RepID=A0A8R1I588_CAEJA